MDLQLVGGLVMDYRELMRTAEKAKKNSYSPYSRFRVGAALLTRGGKVYTGVNVENATYGAAICAERTAVVKAVSEGEREFDAIAVSSDAEEGSLPCGICRQFLAEFGGDIKVITGRADREIKIHSVSELLPCAFSKAELESVQASRAIGDATDNGG
jgi:cytidine deaminase